MINRLRHVQIVQVLDSNGASGHRQMVCHSQLHAQSSADEKSHGISPISIECVYIYIYSM